MSHIVGPNAASSKISSPPVLQGVAVKPNHAAICQPLNRQHAARANARRAVTVVAMAAATAARPPRPHAVPAASLIRCAPVST